MARRSHQPAVGSPALGVLQVLRELVSVGMDVALQDVYQVGHDGRLVSVIVLYLQPGTDLLV
jgi:hypothetical protein